MDRNDHETYWRSNLRYVAAILGAWAAVSLGAGVLAADALDRLRLFGFPLGFWFGQQGALLAFVALVWLFCVLMNALERKHGVQER